LIGVTIAALALFWLAAWASTLPYIVVGFDLVKERLHTPRRNFPIHGSSS
jgi:hypothetical protein